MAAVPLTIAAVNAMSRAEFVAAFGGVAEESPWVAEAAAAMRPFADRQAMIEVFQAAVDRAPPETQRALLVAHPDLAGKAAIAGAVTDDSKREQAGAGLNTLTPTEFGRFSAMNDRYRKRHRIPFIFAVRGATKHDILAGFEARIDNTPETEFAIALTQVQRIMRFRLEDRVAP